MQKSRNVLIFDLETTGLDPKKDVILEVGYILWSAEHRSMLECYSSLIQTLPENFQEDTTAVNGIKSEMALSGQDPDIVWSIVEQAAHKADMVVAHFARFDRMFTEAEGTKLSMLDPFEQLLGLPWVCSSEDLIWPQKSAKSQSLVGLALAHGIAVTSAHRAINDCWLLMRLLEYGTWEHGKEFLQVGLERSQRPKANFISRAPFDQNGVVKKHNFHWDGNQWARYMAVEDAEALPFEVINADMLSPPARLMQAPPPLRQGECIESSKVQES